MIIGVDAGCLGTYDNRLKAGVYYVALHLLQELSKIDTENRYILYSFYPIPTEAMQQFSPKWKNVVLPQKGWFNFWLPLQFFKQKPNIFLAMSQAIPWYHPFKTIGFIHGLDFLPEFHGTRNAKLRRNSEYLILRADILITTSQFLKNSLEKNYTKTEIIVSPLGINPIFFQKSNPYSTNKPYFLFVGTLKPSKNIPNMLRAFSIFLKKTKKDYLLLCIGSDFWLDKTIAETIEALQLKEYIRFLPFIENENLPSYYQGATAFVSPVLYEGFGLPYVEAMASGCPIIASPVGALPEIVGDAGLLVDPKDSNKIADAMIRIMKDNTLRNKLITKGKEQAKNFHWEKFAKDVLQVMKRYN